MKIHKKNIEQYMFDYFEGNLTSQEKDALLSYIHLNPEFESDFVHWAQSYAHIGEPLVDYQITETLLQSSPKKGLPAKSYLWALGVVFTLLFYYSYDKIKENEKQVSKKIVNHSRPNVIKNNTTNKVVAKTKPYKSKIGLSESVKYEKELSLETSKLIERELETGKIKLENTVSIETSPKVDTVVHIKEVEKVIASQAIKKTEKKSVSKKRKKKSFVNLNTDPDFIEENPNF